VEAFFNQQAATGSGPDPPPAEIEAGCLRRAWTRLTTRGTTLQEILGLAMANGADSAAALWAQMRASHGTLPDILCFLTRLYHRSLLGDYRCLHVPT